MTSGDIETRASWDFADDGETVGGNGAQTRPLDAIISWSPVSHALFPGARNPAHRARMNIRTMGSELERPDEANLVAVRATPNLELGDIQWMRRWSSGTAGGDTVTPARLQRQTHADGIEQSH